MSEKGQGPNGARSLRGGSWNNNENHLARSGRNYNNPDNRNNNVGFRVVCSQSCPHGRPSPRALMPAVLRNAGPRPGHDMDPCTRVRLRPGRSKPK